MAYRIEYDYPISDPLTLLGGEAAVEEHLRLTIPASGAERDHIVLLAEGAIRHVIDMTGRAPVAGEATVHTSTIPVHLSLPFKIKELTSASYLKDGENTYTALDSTHFGVYGNTNPGTLFSRNAFTDPGDTELDHPFPFKFVFKTAADDELKTLAVVDDPDTGTDETAAAVRQTGRVFQLCALLFLSHLYENRQAVAYSTSKAIEVPLAFKHLVASIARIR